MVLKSLLFQFVHPHRIGNAPTLTSSKRTGLAMLQLSQARNALKLATPSVQQRPAWQGKRAAVFLMVGQLLLYSCAVESVLWDSCSVTRSPSCERLHRQTDNPLPPPHLCRLFVHVSVWWDGPCMASSQLQEDQKSVVDFTIWDDLESILLWACRRPTKIEKLKCSFGRTIQRAIWSDRPDPVAASFRQVRTHAMMYNRDHLCELPHVFVPTTLAFFSGVSEAWGL